MDYIEVKMPRALLVFTHSEFQSLLAKDTELWATALKRGKSFTRTRQARARMDTRMDS